jgi:hypothetical protein
MATEGEAASMSRELDVQDPEHEREQRERAADDEANEVEFEPAHGIPSRLTRE